ncbi:MAG TPA: ribosome small subunit-dependent GTPase A [Gammaproteobacteria bacterium]|nr:ribosome small subunit-dependent GTPase A [Gammaproteobacteria bacterium]
MTKLADLGFDDFFASQLERLADPQWVPARIVAEGQSSFHLSGCRAPLGDLSGSLRGSITKTERPVVGDWVAVVDGADRASIQRVFERRTTLIRRAAGTLAEPQVVAANVDVFFVVTAVNRDFNERRLERYVAAVWNSGGKPVVVLNKVDLETNLDEMLEAIDRAAIGVPVVRASAATGTGVDELRAYIAAGKTVGFIGSSGVGKSSLTNRLLGREVQAVGGLRDDERGRHTTTARQLIELPGGGVLIDTPGMRELGLLDDVGGIDTSFPDVVALAERCRFRDCAHESEPGCAVLAAVESGELSAERFASYRKLLAEIAAAERKRDPILAGRTKARWKATNRALRARTKIDPKLQRDK